MIKATILGSSAGVNLVIAYATGHTMPSSRCLHLLDAIGHRGLSSAKNPSYLFLVVVGFCFMGLIPGSIETAGFSKRDRCVVIVPSHEPRIIAGMRPIKSIASLAAVLLATLACGSVAGSSNASTSTTSPSADHMMHHAAVDVAGSKFGQILVDGQGKALYLFAADTGSTPTCYGSCATVWPPFLADKGATIDAMHAATASLTGTTTRTDGTVQVTYNGHPLYFYSGDKKAGDVLCQGAVDHGGAWYVVSPQGSAITKT